MAAYIFHGLREEEKGYNIKAAKELVYCLIILESQ